MKIKGKIGYCTNRDLGLTNNQGQALNGGHYVYIRKVNGERCDVNVITSLEDRNGKFDYAKLHKVRKGFLYPIPKRDANFSQWSAINLDNNVKNVKVSRVKNIGVKSIKKRHKFFVGKFGK